VQRFAGRFFHVVTSSRLLLLRVRVDLQILLEVDHPAHAVGVDQADNDAERFLAPDDVGSIHTRGQAHLGQQLVEVLHLLPGFR